MLKVERRKVGGRSVTLSCERQSLCEGPDNASFILG
jgi:hypothetical protein